MNYRHGFHAGNFADVFKHVVLIALIEHLTIKETPLCYLDAHAGKGQYHLQSVEAQKTQEYKEGIVELMRMIAESSPPPIVQRYLKIVQGSGFPIYYPGSPFIARSCLRSQDRLILLELHPHECQDLKALFKQDTQTIIHCQDAYVGLKACLPPKERRGLVLIDPPYEDTHEWDHLLTGLKIALKKFQTGTYAIWYPITKMNSTKVTHFLDSIHQQHDKVLVSECIKYPLDSPVGLIGCGMCIINPPWQLDLLLKQVVPWLQKVLQVK